jgi:predicted permease
MTDALLQVFLMIVVGIVIARVGWVEESLTQSFSSLVLRVFLPALLFRSMAQVRFESLSFGPILGYLPASFLLFWLIFWTVRRWGRPLGLLAAQGQDTAGGYAAAVGISAVFSNTVMIGIPLVKLFYGAEGLVVMLTVVTLHALVLLGSAVVAFEASVHGRSRRSRLLTLRHLFQTALFHPVVIPVFAGVAYSYSGLELPVVIDGTLAAMGQVAVPACLVLLGSSVYHARNQLQPRGIGPVLLLKMVVHPMAVFLVSRWVFELPDLTVAVLTTVASLPTGSNPYLLAQRYNQGVSISATAVVASTALSAISLPYVLSLFAS